VISSTRLVAVVFGIWSVVACREPAAERTPYVEASANPPIDRLAPNELAQSSSEVFGFPLPRGMKVEQAFSDVAYSAGRVSPEAVANYVRTRVEVSHVEVAAARTVFPNARIKSGAKDRVYQLEVSPHHGGTKLVIRDVTPPVPAKGLSEAERWRRAGMTPDGKPLDPNKLE
jgi:hypothetical protein